MIIKKNKKEDSTLKNVGKSEKEPKLNEASVQENSNDEPLMPQVQNSNTDVEKFLDKVNTEICNSLEEKFAVINPLIEELKADSEKVGELITNNDADAEKAANEMLSKANELEDSLKKEIEEKNKEIKETPIFTEYWNGHKII